MSQSGGYHLNESGGYEYKFTVEPSEDFICTLCHLVLKNPLQLEDCGHIFCKSCYENMKSHTEANSLELLCPLDRLKIHPTHVFKDKATERKILNLEVQCSNFGDGCKWTGELRNIQNHEENCLKNQIKEVIGIELKHLLNRMTELELVVEANKLQLVEKDKQISIQRKLTEVQNKHIDNLSKEIKELSKQIKNQDQAMDIQKKQFKNQNKQQTDILNKTNIVQNNQIEDHQIQIKAHGKKIESHRIELEDHHKQIEDLRNLKEEQIKDFNIRMENHSLLIKTSQHQPSIIIPGSEYISSEYINHFSAVTTSFEWKFNVDRLRTGDELKSPLFYNSKNLHCFQLTVFYDHRDNFSTYLCRCRGKFDLDVQKVILKTDEFVFNIHLLGNNKYKRELKYIYAAEVKSDDDSDDDGDDDDADSTDCDYWCECDDYSINADAMQSDGEFQCISNDDIIKLTVDANVHLHCFFN